MYHLSILGLSKIPTRCVSSQLTNDMGSDLGSTQADV